MADSARKPGSDRGRAALDWEAAYAYYAALPPERRSYDAVAREFAVSVRTVEKRGRLGRWRERVRTIEAQAGAELDRQLGQARVKQIADVEKLIEASFLTYAQQLRNGDVQIKAADLPRLVKLLLDLWQEPAAPEPALTGSAARTVPSATERSLGHKLEVLRALHESGALPPLEPPRSGDDSGEPELEA
jgi:hypothetical protein